MQIKKFHNSTFYAKNISSSQKKKSINLAPVGTNCVNSAGYEEEKRESVFSEATYFGNP